LIESTSGIGRDNRFIGTWKSTTTTSITCFSGGTSIYTQSRISGSGTWEIKNGKSVLTESGGSVSYNFVFSNNNNVLTLP
jgi:hypothetical protein